MNRSSAQPSLNSPIVWRIQPSEPGALSALAQALQAQRLPAGATFEREASALAVIWDPLTISTAAVRQAAIDAARAARCTLRALSLSALNDAQRAAIAGEALAEPNLSEASILEAAIERSWAR